MPSGSNHYNSLPGVKPVKALKDPKTAASKIWERVAKLGQMVAPEQEAVWPMSEVIVTVRNIQPNSGDSGEFRGLTLL